MKLLEAEPVVAPEVAPEPPRETPPEQAPAPTEAGRTCHACGAAMEADQDWCLACGTAARGSLGERPGWRAASTVMALALLLVLGAVGAGYAALKSDDSAKTASTSAAAAAQPPAQAQVAPSTTQAPTTTPSTPTQQQTTTTPKSSTLPKVHATKPSTTQGAPVTPVNPTPTTSTPTTSTPSGTTSTPTTSTPSSTTTQPQDTGPQPIELKGDAASPYDPYGRAKATGQTERALDDDASTSWYVDPKDAQSIGVGYAVDLGKLQGIREIQLQTTTPGFKMEVYATDEPELPPDILDTRWSHITNVADVGTKDDGKQKIVLGAGTTKYRNLLLWFTTPPTGGPRLRIAELKVLG